MHYEDMWIKLKKWVEKEDEDMLKRCQGKGLDMYYSGISCQTQYIKAKMEELEGK